MAEQKKESLTEEEFGVLFGPQPPRYTQRIKGRPDLPGIDVTFQEIVDDQRLEIERQVGRQPSEEEKMAVRVRETLAQSIVEVDGRPVPASIEERRTFIGKQRESIIVLLSRVYTDWRNVLNGVELVIRTSDPNSSGANPLGDVFAPRVVGPGER